MISFSLNVHPTDTIASIKEQLASEHSRAPPADVQRLLIKGKVLADNKLLKEYDGVGDGTILSLMVKPGTVWTAEEKPSVNKTVSSTSARTPSPNSVGLEAAAEAHARRHARTPSEGGLADQFPVPSLVLVGPSSPTETGRRRPVSLSLDLDVPPRPSSPSAADSSSYNATITSTGFWQRLHAFLDHEFGGSDGDAAFENFLLGSKGSLTAGDIARIRDSVQVTGMAGT